MKRPTSDQIVWANQDGEFMLYDGSFGNPGCDTCGVEDAVVCWEGRYLCELHAGDNGIYPWNDDLTQFARLLCEIRATQENLDVDDLCLEMDLDVARIEELFDRAHKVWETAKAARG